MSSHFPPEISSALRATIDGEPGACATLSVVGQPKLWLQIADNTVNAAYPLEDEPGTVLELLPAVEGMSVSSWESRKYCTVAVEDLSVPDLPEWIDAYFIEILKAPVGAYELNLKLEEL